MYKKFSVKIEEMNNDRVLPDVEYTEGVAKSMDDLVKMYIRENEFNAYALDKLRKKDQTNYILFQHEGAETYLMVKEIK